jgi:hypothetical protein
VHTCVRGEPLERKRRGGGGEGGRCQIQKAAVMQRNLKNNSFKHFGKEQKKYFLKVSP